MEIKNSKEILIRFSKNLNEYSLDFISQQLISGKYKILITEGNDTKKLFISINIIHSTDIIPNSYFYTDSKQLYLIKTCELSSPLLSLKGENNLIDLFVMIIQNIIKKTINFLFFFTKYTK